LETLEAANPQNINTPHRKKEKVEGEERKWGNRKSSSISSCSTSFSVFTLVSFYHFQENVSGLFTFLNRVWYNRPT
jgi:hypothetical protein